MKCTHPTNEKDGLCVICRNPKFGQGEMKPLPNPASRHYATKKHQGTKVKGHTGSVLSQNPYLLDDLQLLILAQVSLIFDLAKEGKLDDAVNRINLTNEAVRNAK